MKAAHAFAPQIKLLSQVGPTLPSIFYFLGALFFFVLNFSNRKLRRNFTPANKAVISPLTWQSGDLLRCHLSSTYTRHMGREKGHRIRQFADLTIHPSTESYVSTWSCVRCSDSLLDLSN